MDVLIKLWIYPIWRHPDMLRGKRVFCITLYTHYGKSRFIHEVHLNSLLLTFRLIKLESFTLHGPTHFSSYYSLQREWRNTSIPQKSTFLRVFRSQIKIDGNFVVLSYTLSLGYCDQISGVRDSCAVMTCACAQCEIIRNVAFQLLFFHLTD